MTPESKLNAWDVMTTQEQDAWIAVNIMKWKTKYAEGTSSAWFNGSYKALSKSGEELGRVDDGCCDRVFRPTEDENDFRMAIESMMDEKRLKQFFHAMMKLCDGLNHEIMMMADLKTRCAALYLAMQ